MTRFLACLLFVALVTPASAAQRVVERSVRIARATWSDYPDRCHPTIVQRAPLRRYQLGQASIDMRHDGTTGECVITIDSRYRFSPGAFCGLLVHEWGHTVGWTAPPGEAYGTDTTHSSNPRSVMYPAAHPPAPKRCRAEFGDRWTARFVGP